MPASGLPSRDSRTPRALTLDSTAAALPRLRLCETTIAPAAAAWEDVSSLLPSSQTITKETPGSCAAAADRRCHSVLLILRRNDADDPRQG